MQRIRAADFRAHATARTQLSATTSDAHSMLAASLLSVAAPRLHHQVIADPNTRSYVSFNHHTLGPGFGWC